MLRKLLLLSLMISWAVPSSNTGWFTGRPWPERLYVDFGHYNDLCRFNGAYILDRTEGSENPQWIWQPDQFWCGRGGAIGCYGDLPKRIYRGLDERWRIGSFTRTDAGPVDVDDGFDFEGPCGDSPWDGVWDGVLVSKSQTWWSP